MDINTIQPSTKGIDLTIKAAESVNQINQMIVDTNQDLNQKMINVNVQQKLDDLRQEGIAQAINVLA